MDIYLVFIFFLQIYLREGLQTVSKRLFDILAEYYDKTAIPFLLPLGYRARGVPDSLAVRVNHVIEVGQCNMVDMVQLPEQTNKNLLHKSPCLLLLSLFTSRLNGGGENTKNLEKGREAR